MKQLLSSLMPKISARILIVDDDPDVLTAARVVLRQQYETVETEGNPQKLKYLLNQQQYDVILLDMNYSAGKTSGGEGLFWLRQILETNPDQQVVMITAYGDIKLAVEAMKIGAADFVVKPWENEKLEASVKACLENTLSRKQKHTPKSKRENSNQFTETQKIELLGRSSMMKAIFDTVNKVARTEANVLLLGENGTGKELLARYIHKQSARKDKPFVKVDVGSLPSGLFESELFGHRKGAFTDAREDRIGRIELAHGGTLFLDEIGNLAAPLQVKLLSVLQSREVTSLGSSVPSSVDIRLICATNRQIYNAVSAGEFREDLLYRINTVEITLPPLRKRVEDIALLANHFTQYYADKYGKKINPISQDVMRFLEHHSWPGNVRELQHAIERAVIMSDLSDLRKQDFVVTTRKEIQRENETFSLDEIEKQTIIAAVHKHEGNLSKVAKELGVGRTTLYRKMIRYGINRQP